MSKSRQFRQSWFPLSDRNRFDHAADILAKTWSAAEDRFQYKVFHNCSFCEKRWDDAITEGGESLIGLGWRPVSFMRLPHVPRFERGQAA